MGAASYLTLVFHFVNLNAADDFHHDLGGAGPNGHKAKVAHGAGNAVIFVVTPSAMDLEGLVGHFKSLFANVGFGNADDFVSRRAVLNEFGHRPVRQ